MIKKWAKSLLFRAIADLGSFLPFTRNCNIIVGLHKVVDSSMNSCWPSSPMKNFSMSSEFFRALIRKMKSEYDIIPVKELIIRTKNGRRNGLAAITFDDGFVDCYKTAFPILKHMKVPASIYLNPAFINNPQLPWEYVLENCLGLFHGTLQVNISQKRFTFSIESDRHRYKTFMYIRPVLTRLNRDERNNIIEQICDLAGYVADQDHAKGLFLSWEMAREMLSSGLIEFGNHGLNHLSFGTLSAREATEEILSSHDIIKKELEIEPVGFSFPYGQKRDYSDVVTKILRDNGYVYALTAENGFVKRDQPAFSVPRIVVRENDGLTRFDVYRSILFAGVQRLLAKIY